MCEIVVVRECEWEGEMFWGKMVVRECGDPCEGEMWWGEKVVMKCEWKGMMECRNVSVQVQNWKFALKAGVGPPAVSLASADC